MKFFVDEEKRKHPIALAILNFKRDIIMVNVGCRTPSTSVIRYGMSIICLT